MLNYFSTKTAPLAATVCGGLLIAGFAFKLDDPLAPVSVSKSYQINNLGSIDLQGACNVTPDTVSCWNADGKADPDMTEKVKAFYIVQNTSELRYRFGRKNRLVVFKRPSQTNLQGIYLGNVMTPSGGYVNSAGQIGQNGNDREPYLEWYPVDVDPADTSCGLVFNLNLNMGSGNIPLKEGAEAQLGAIKAHINSIKPGPGRQTWDAGSVHEQKTWDVSVTMSGFSGSTYPNLSALFYDSKGDPITRLDAAGNPLVERPRPVNSYMQFQGPHGLTTSVDLQGAGQATQHLIIPANPTKVSAMNLILNGTKKITFADIPLDPK